MKLKTILGVLLLGILVFGVAYNIGEKQRNTKEITKQLAENTVKQISPDEMVETGPKVGKAAPDFELTTLTGETVKLSDLRGKKVIVNFWATWCGPCREEVPALEKFYQEYKDKNLEVLAVNLTKDELKEENVKEFAETFDMSFPVPLDKAGTVGEQYQIYYVPTSYFINEEGIITLKSGPMTYEQMVQFYKKAF